MTGAGAAAPAGVGDPVNAAILAVSEDRVRGFRRDPLGDIAARSGVELPVGIQRLGGRVLRRSTPHFANVAAPNTSYECDSFAPVGCNLGGVLCPDSSAGGASPGGASARTLWAFVAVSATRWVTVVDVFWGSDGVGGHLRRVPVRHTAWSAARVRAGVDRQPADEPLLTGRQLLSICVGAVPGVNSRRPHVRWQSDKGALDVHGNPVSAKTEAAHIPLEEFRFIPPDLLPR